MDTSTPQDALARKAGALAAAGDSAGAIRCLEDALRRDPRQFRAWIILGRLLHQEKRYADALRAVRAAEQFDPLQADFQAIQQCMQRQDFSQAERLARAMLEREPGHPRAVFTLAYIAQARDDHEGCAAILEEGLSHSPANLNLRHMLIGAQEASGAYRRAIETARQLAETAPSFETLWALVGVLLRYGQNEDVLAVCDQAGRFAKDAVAESEIELVRGQVYRILGEREKSVAALRACLAKNPRNAAGWWGLADFKTYTFTDSDRQSIRAILADPAVPGEQKSMAAFALAKASEAEGDWDRSMPLYQQANALRPGAVFNPEQFAAAASRLTEAFTPDTLVVQAKAEAPGPVPIFIVGLPRSGSTLLEQILASHSQIEGTIEQPVLPAIKRKAHRLCVERFGGDYLAGVGRLPQADLTALGEAYLAESALFRTGERAFFTDKMPFNFEHAGLIHKILPNAVIIDMRRNPLDCGFSLFRQYFAQGSAFSYDLGNIASYYNGYLKIMEHWDAVLPGRVLRVQYEALVAEPEAQIREILAHVGAPFEAACLNFHQTARAVRTASSEQVRQPLYAGSVGLWREAEAHLQPLKTGLGDETLARFAPWLG